MNPRRKKSDKNHVRKNIVNDLYKLQQNHTSFLTQKVIEFLTLAQNQDNEKGLKQTFSAIVHHAYGDHSLCQERWCRSFHESSAYEHHHLDRDLDDQELKKDLEVLLTQYAESATKLTNLGSSQKKRGAEPSYIYKSTKGEALRRK